MVSQGSPEKWQITNQFQLGLSLASPGILGRYRNLIDWLPWHGCVSRGRSGSSSSSSSSSSVLNLANSRGWSMSRCSAAGNHAWIGQCGTRTSPVAQSSRIICSTRGITLKGGKHHNCKPCHLTANKIYSNSSGISPPWYKVGTWSIVGESISSLSTLQPQVSRICWNSFVGIVHSVPLWNILLSRSACIFWRPRIWDALSHIWYDSKCL